MLVDTGIADRPTRVAWEALLPPLGRVQAVLVTHHHPDHVGLAGWLCERRDAPLWTSRTSFLSVTAFAHLPGLLEADDYGRFYAAHGTPPEIAALVSTQGHRYLRMIAMPPRTYRRLAAGTTLSLGGRTWELLSGDGHSPEQLMLRCGELLLAADQVIDRITPNVSVSAFEPADDPLGDYEASLRALAAGTAEGALVLAGHRLPFVGLGERVAAILDHHAARCELILGACAESPRSVWDLLPLLFPRPLDPHETSFALSEALAHANRLVAGGALRWEERGGLRRVRRT